MPDHTATAELVPWCPPGWERGTFPHAGHRHPFFIVDRTEREAAPRVLLLHEMPGIDDNLVAYANDLARDFRVFVPSIIGRPGKVSPALLAKQICVRREVHILARDGVSRSVGWLRDFAAQHVADDSGSYGVIGMCFSGNFALALAVDPRVAAAVVAEPASPVGKRALGLSVTDASSLRAREGLCVQGYRFRDDPASPPGKLQAAQDLLGSDRMQVFTLDEPDPKKHSVLTGGSASRAAIAGVRAFLQERLGTAAV